MLRLYTTGEEPNVELDAPAYMCVSGTWTSHACTSCVRDAASEHAASRQRLKHEVHANAKVAAAAPEHAVQVGVLATSTDQDDAPVGHDDLRAAISSTTQAAVVDQIRETCAYDKPHSHHPESPAYRAPLRHERLVHLGSGFCPADGGCESVIADLFVAEAPPADEVAFFDVGTPLPPRLHCGRRLGPRRGSRAW